MAMNSYNDAASQATMHAFRSALDPLLAKMNQDYRVHHMEVGRRDVYMEDVEEVVIKIVLRRPIDFNYAGRAKLETGGIEPEKLNYVPPR